MTRSSISSDPSPEGDAAPARQAGIKHLLACVDGSDNDAMAAALPGAKLLYLESPTSMVFELQEIEAVEMLTEGPHPRKTVCVSTQVGCAYGCKFCASGLEGFSRNLEPGELERLHRAVRSAYRISLADHQSEAEAFNRAVELLMEHEPLVGRIEARRRVARMLAQEPASTASAAALLRR